MKNQIEIQKLVNSNLNPFEIFKKCFEVAKSNKNIIEPTAMCLSTAGPENKPSSRMVLLKKFDENGFCFYTNLNSRKAQELKSNNFVALCFYWGILQIQIRIEGKIQPVSVDEADEYFASRRRESQIGAWASNQSHKMSNWQDFLDKITMIEDKFHNQTVPRPEFWSGFRVVPTAIEFWQEGDFRIHQRFLFEKNSNNWVVNKLYP